tara:strand:+ start:33 stop:260 length:228 start_codon:yes stop_codon:yes gene_type:complete
LFKKIFARSRKNSINKLQRRHIFMDKLFTIFTLSILLISCGGGGGYGGSSADPNTYGSTPTGNFAGQVDPVQTTD